MSDREVFALKHAQMTDRVRTSNVILSDAHDASGPMDLHIWVLRRGDEAVLVDTGYAGAMARGRPVRMDPREALRTLGPSAEAVPDLVVTHLHSGHAGGLHLFPDARLHRDAVEMACAAGRCMCHAVLRAPFTAGRVWRLDRGPVSEVPR